MRWMTLALVIALGTGTPVFAATQCPADPQLARLVSVSPVIVIGVSRATPDQVTKAAAAKLNYVSMPLDGIGWLKGQAYGEPLVVEASAQDVPNRPSIAALKQAYGKSRLIFLTHRDGSRGGFYYFAGPDSLREVLPKNIADTQAEIARQADILAHWKADVNLPHYEAVKSLIVQLAQISPTDPKQAFDQQQVIFDALEALGPEAVPAIIAQMDDRRTLARTFMSVRDKSPQAFQPQMFYGPEKIVDALAAVLHQISGENFGPIYAGASDRERDEAVAGWRVYGYDLGCRDASR